MKTARSFVLFSFNSPMPVLRIGVVAACALLLAAAQSYGATLSWSGGSASGANWSDSANWGYAGVPLSGDTLVFSAGQPRLTNTNNISSLILNQIRFAGAGGGYNIYGLGITLTNSIQATNTAGTNWIFNAITLATADVTVNVNSSLILGGQLTGSVGVTKTGAGSLSYRSFSANTYAGTTRVNAGTLVLYVGAIDRAFSGPLVIGDGSGAGSPTVRLDFDREIPDTAPVTVNLGGLLDLNSLAESFGSLTLQGGTVTSGTATLTLNSNLTVLASTATATISGYLKFTGGLRTITVEDGAAFYDLNLYANVTDDGGGLLITNSTPVANFVRLLGSNSFTGPLTIANVRVAAENPWSLGATNGGTTIKGNTALWLYQTGITNETLTLDNAALFVGQNNNTWSGPMTLNGGATIQVYPAGYTLDLVSLIGGTGGFTKTDAGTLVLSGPGNNTYAGNTIVNEGVLALNKASNLAIQYGSLIIGDSLGGTNADVVRYTGASVSEIMAGVPIIIKSSGWLDLNGHHDDVGPITMDSGRITTDAGSLILNEDVTAYCTVSSNAYPSIAGNVILNPTRIFNVTNAGLMVTADIADYGISGLTKTGAGDLFLQGSNSYAGLTLVQQGHLWVETPWALGGTAAGTVVSNGASLVLIGGIGVTNESLTLNGPGVDSNWGALDSETQSGTFGDDIWAGPITLNADSTISVWNSDGVLRINGTISGAGGFEQISASPGFGSIYLQGTNANTYAGTTRVRTGTLYLNKTATPAIPGTLDVQDTVRLLISDQMADTSDVSIGSAGVLDLNGSSDFIDALSGSGSVTLGAVNNYLVIGDNNGSSTYDGIISGAGRIYKYGSGTITLTGNNTLTGTTYAFQGTLLVNGSQSQSRGYVYSSGTLGGTGTFSEVYCAGNLLPGTSPGILTCSNLTFTSAGDYFVDLTGPTPGTGYDQLVVRGTNELGSAVLHVTPAFTTPAAIGDQFVIINNDGSDAIAGTFNGLPNGSTISSNGFSFTINYAGGSGNDVVLTVADVPLAEAGFAVTSGNANAAIDPDECNRLSVVITNKTGLAMTGISARLDSADAGAIVTQPFSTYPNVPAYGRSTNALAFELSTLPSFACGSNITLNLMVATSSHGAFSMPVTLNSGEIAATPLRYDVNISTNIPDLGTIESTNTVAGFSGPLMKVAVSLWLTHTLDADLSISLIAPDGTLVDLSSGNGGGANFGSASSPDSSRTTFNDSAAVSITAGSPPFVGSFRPEGSLASALNSPANGNWRLRITDSYGGTLGTLRCWSLFLYPSACAPGGGACALCSAMTAITNTLTAGSAVQTGRLIRNGIASTCASSKVCPGPNDVLARHYAAYPFYNASSNTCITVILASSGGCDLFSAAYLGGFNPTNLCENYLGDAGNSTGGATRSYSFTAPANSVFVVTVNEVSTSLCGSPYVLTISGGDCVPILAAEPVPAKKVNVNWPTVAGGYNLEATPSLTTTNWMSVTNPPVASDGRFNVTNSTTSPTNRFYRLHKPQ
jgi:autotransporter-associated beta strand protein